MGPIYFIGLLINLDKSPLINVVHTNHSLCTQNLQLLLVLLNPGREKTLIQTVAMPALTRNKKKAATKSQTPPLKVTKPKTPPSKNQAKPQASTLKKGAKSQKKPPLKKQKKEVVVEEEPLEDDEVSDGSDEDDVSTDVESEEIDESEDGVKGSNGFFSDGDDDDEEDNDDDEETLGDDFLEGSGDEEEEEEGPSDADSDSDSDEENLQRRSISIDRKLAKQKHDADAELQELNKQDGPDEESEHDAFRLPTQEVTFFYVQSSV